MYLPQAVIARVVSERGLQDGKCRVNARIVCQITAARRLDFEYSVFLVLQRDSAKDLAPVLL
jgi:hypothetical protein